MSLEEILRYAIQPLVYFKYKVLQKEKDDDPKAEKISKTDVFLLRDKVPAKKLPRKIQFPAGSATSEKKESDEGIALIERQREFEIGKINLFLLPFFFSILTFFLFDRGCNGACYEIS